jgi:hypothetical protein
VEEGAKTSRQQEQYVKGSCGQQQSVEEVRAFASEARGWNGHVLELCIPLMGQSGSSFLNHNIE